jgi:hypothetical protein
VGPVASTTEVEDDIDGGPPVGCCRQVRQRPPPSLKMTLMAGLLEDAAGGSGNIRHRVLKSMASPLGGTTDGSDSIDH